MQGDFVRALAQVSKVKGWDPSKLEDESIEVGLHRSLSGDRSLSPMVKAEPENNSPLKDSTPWSRPQDPYAGSNTSWAREVTWNEPTERGSRVPPVREPSVDKAIDRRRAGMHGGE
jgi:hypothetical protein